MTPNRRVHIDKGRAFRRDSLKVAFWASSHEVSENPVLREVLSVHCSLPSFLPSQLALATTRPSRRWGTRPGSGMIISSP